MKTRITSCILAAMCSGMVCAELRGQGTSFTYQGRIMDTDGSLNGAASMVFRLYATPTFGVPLWGEAHASIPVSNGLFSITLGRNSPVDETIFNGAPRWLGISVNGSPELAPRTQIAAAPYAITARRITGSVSAGQLTGTIAPEN